MVRFAFVTLSLVALLCAASLLGGVWVWAALVYMTGFAYAIDRLSPVLLSNAPEGAEFPAADPLSVSLAIAHFLVLGLGVTALANGDAGVLEKLALFTAIALFAGQVGHPNAHELIHRGNRMLRRLGVAVYASILMGHHASAHPLVHHVHVATARDPVSAPKGRGFWRYAARAWSGAFVAGFQAERARHTAWRHPYVGYVSGAIMALLAGYLMADIKGALIWAAIGIYAQVQILLSDYVQHYGLRRKILANGKPEPVAARHSWNTPHRFSSAMMLNAPRHSDHHTHPSRVYPALQLEPDDMPMLPYSLPMMAVIALVPPLWRRIMDPRVAKWEN